MKINFIYQLMYQILIIIVPFITTPYISRVLGAEGVGIYSYTYAVVSYFVLLGKMGIDMYGTRLIAMQKNNKTKISEKFWNLFAVHLVFSGISILGYILTVMVISENQSILAIQGIYLIGQLLDVNWLFFGLENFKLTVTRNVLVKLIILAGIFIFVKESRDLYKYVLILAVGTSLGELAVWVMVPRYVIWHCPVLKEMKLHFWPIIKLSVPVIATSIYTMMDKLFIKYYCGAISVGYYENALKIVSVGRVVTLALGTVTLPKASKLIAESKRAELKRSIDSSLFVAVWFAIGFLYGIAGIASNFVPLFLGNEFEASIFIIYMLLPCIPCWAIASVFRTQYLIPRKKDNVYIYSQVVAALINFILNMLLIPIFGTNGAVIGTVAAEFAVCIAMMRASRDIMNFRLYLIKWFLLNIFGMAMYLMIKFIGMIEMSIFINMILQVMAGGMVYVIMSILMIRHDWRKENVL